MANQAEPEFLRSLIPSLPAEFSRMLRSICTSNPANEIFLENFVRLITGADCTAGVSPTLQKEWSQRQAETRQALTQLLKLFQSSSETHGGVKRPHDESSSEGSKRQRLSPPGPVSGPDPVQFTFHAISATSPVRKKVDISIGKSDITCTNATSGNVEATISLLSLRRCFLLPTRGKTKAHWTVVLLSSDLTGKSSTKGTTSDNPQIIFGLDATTTTALTTTLYDEKYPNGEKEVIAKGNPSLPAIRSFLSNLPSCITQYEPTADVFKSSVNQFGSAGKTVSTSPGVEAYRAAKQGTLWFMKEGLLWGESKPCEFWALEDLLNPEEGVRLSPGSGRVFSVTIARKEKKEPGGEEMQVDTHGEEDDVGVETELGMIDSRERDAVHNWVRAYQNSFGGKPGEGTTNNKASTPKTTVAQQAGPLTIRSLALASDSEDEDFVGSDDNSDADSNSNDGDEEDQTEESDAAGEDEEPSEDGAVDAEADLDPAHHPLLRHGAIPKMSKAALNMVVSMVEDDLMGVAGDAGNENEVDELED